MYGCAAGLCSCRMQQARTIPCKTHGAEIETEAGQQQLTRNSWPQHSLLSTATAEWPQRGAGGLRQLASTHRALTVSSPMPAGAGTAAHGA